MAANDMAHMQPSLENTSKASHESLYKDRLSKKVQVVRQEHHLSRREAEVMELIARGNTVSAIAEELYISENTVRTHAKRIYSKLDIHKRQELVELLAKADVAKLDTGTAH